MYSFGTGHRVMMFGRKYLIHRQLVSIYIHIYIYIYIYIICFCLFLYMYPILLNDASKILSCCVAASCAHCADSFVWNKPSTYARPGSTSNCHIIHAKLAVNDDWQKHIDIYYMRALV